MHACRCSFGVLLCYMYSLNACSLGEENGLFSEESNETQAVSRNYKFMHIVLFTFVTQCATEC